MSFENQHCPCGGKKPTDTMLCDDCNSTFNARREWREYQDGTLPISYRRNAAIILLALARRRLNLKVQV